MGGGEQLGGRTACRGGRDGGEAIELGGLRLLGFGPFELPSRRSTMSLELVVGERVLTMGLSSSLSLLEAMTRFLTFPAAATLTIVDSGSLRRGS